MQTTIGPALAAARNSLRLGRARILVALLALSFAGCSVYARKLSVQDPRVRTLLDAALEFDRTQYGFSPLPSIGDVYLESNPRPGAGYDAMLHLYGRTRRTIAFRLVDRRYKWIGEQEIFRNTQTYEGPNGTADEQIVLTYEIEHVTGAPLNRLGVQYMGDDPRLAGKHLTLALVKPILKQWGY